MESRLTADAALKRLNDLFTRRGVPGHIRSDSGPEFAAKTVRDWLGRLRVRTLVIGPGSPCEIGHIESFNEKVRDEFLNPEVFTPAGGAGADRAVATGVQRGPPAQLAGVPATRSGGLLTTAAGSPPAGEADPEHCGWLHPWEQVGPQRRREALSTSLRRPPGIHRRQRAARPVGLDPRGPIIEGYAH